MAKLQLCRLVTKREGSRTGWSQAGSAEHLKGQDPWSNGLGLRHHPTGPLPSPVHKLSHPALFQGMAEAQHPSSPGFIVLQNPALSPLAGCWGAGWSPAGRGPGWPQFSWQDSLSGVLWAPLPPRSSPADSTSERNNLWVWSHRQHEWPAASPAPHSERTGH